MQQVPELVKDGLHLAVSQQRGLVADRRRQISADQAEMRAHAGNPRQEGVHPGPAALVLARVEIGVERAQLRSIRFIADGVVAHLRIPGRKAGFLLDRDPEDPAKNGEHAVHYFLEREIRAQRFFIEIVQRGALLFGVVGDIPGLNLRRIRSFDAAPEFLQASILADKMRFRLRAQIFQELLRARAGVRHAIVDDQVGEIGEAEKLRLFPPQLQNPRDDPAIVEIARSWPGSRRRDTAAAGCSSRRGRSSPACSSGPCRVNRQPGFSFDSALCRAAATALGGSPASLASSSITSSKALVESSTFSEKRVVSLLSSTSISASRTFPGRIEFGALAAEVVERFLQKPGARSSEMGRLFRRGVILQGLPKTFMHQDAGCKRADRRLHGVDARAKLRVGGHRFQVLDDPHRVFQALGDGFVSQHDILEGGRHRAIRQGFQLFLRIDQQFCDGRFDLFRPDPVEGDAELDFK